VIKYELSCHRWLDRLDGAVLAIPLIDVPLLSFQRAHKPISSQPWRLGLDQLVLVYFRPQGAKGIKVAHCQFYRWTEGALSYLRIWHLC
jgi:hypothetical protein